MKWWLLKERREEKGEGRREKRGEERKERGGEKREGDWRSVGGEERGERKTYHSAHGLDAQGIVSLHMRLGRDTRTIRIRDTLATAVEAFQVVLAVDVEAGHVAVVGEGCEGAVCGVLDGEVAVGGAGRG